MRMTLGGSWYANAMVSSRAAPETWLKASRASLATRPTQRRRRARGTIGLRERLFGNGGHSAQERSRPLRSAEAVEYSAQKRCEFV